MFCEGNLSGMMIGVFFSPKNRYPKNHHAENNVIKTLCEQDVFGGIYLLNLENGIPFLSVLMNGQRNVFFIYYSNCYLYILI